MIAKSRIPHSVTLVVSIWAVASAFAQTNTAGFPHSPELQTLVDRAAHETLETFSDRQLTSNQLAITLVDLREPAKPVQASVRGGEQVYPASVVKLFYLAAAHQWMEDGRIADTAELRRAMRDMIVDSYNEATGYIVDLLTDTTSGPELPEAELEKWYERRNAVNRYFTSLGFANINVNRKPWCEGPYGREMQSTKLHKPNHRNWLSTDATARLLAEIATGRAVTPTRSRQMMELLERKPFDPGAEPQSREYIGSALPPESKLWSKAGWTSQTRHDAAYIELPDTGKFVLVIFTTDHAGEKGIITAAAKVIVAGMRAAR